MRLLNRVLVRLEQTGKSAGYGQTDLIEIPDNHEKDFKFCGRVLAVGDKAYPKDNAEVATGDHVIIDTHGQYVFEVGNALTRYAIVRPESLVATLPEGLPKYLDVVPTGARELVEVV